MRQVKEIIIHCSATKEGHDYRAKDIDRWHRQRGFNCIGYHYVIDINGNIEIGRSEKVIGAHCVGHNKESIGICYIGGLDSNSKPKDTRTLQQKKSLHNLVEILLKKYNLKMTDVHCHNEFANKECPCFKMNVF